MPLAAALIAGAGAIGGALISKSASDKASKSATGAASENNALQSHIFDTTNANYAPYRDLGSWAIPRIQSLVGGRGYSNAFAPPQRGANATAMPPAGPPAALTGNADTRPGATLETAGGGSRPPNAFTPDTSGPKPVPPGFGPTAAGDAAYLAAHPGSDIGSVTSTLGGTPAPGGVPGPQPAAGASGPDWNAYIQANPDVASWISQGGGDPALGPNQTPAQAAAYHFQNSGQTEGRAPPPGFSGGAQTPAAPSPDAPNAFQYGPDPGAVPTFAGYQQATRPDQGSAPGMPDLSGNAFEKSPGYEYALKEGLRGVNAYFGARGVLNSGGALTEAMRQGQGMARQDFYNWQNSQLAQQNQAFNQFAANRQNTNTNFDVDTTRGDARTDSARNFDYTQYLGNRDYNAGRFDTNVGALTGLAGIGAGATGAVANAGTNYANAFGNNNNSAASATGNAAIAGANSTNALIGNAFNAYGMYAGLRGNPTVSRSQYGAAPITYPSSFSGY